LRTENDGFCYGVGALFYDDPESV